MNDFGITNIYRVRYTEEDGLQLWEIYDRENKVKYSCTSHDAAHRLCDNLNDDDRC